MSALTVTRAQAYAATRAVLDQALADIAADYAAGRLSPERAAAYERLLTRHRRDQLVAAA
ncbi:hypothetical protein ACWD5R_11280 [Streptomyces sp. NPDC002514]|uniref:hypothetical protein n=1 Tax=unclassified Streptomyces TaxID=2593676 RepID=UPI0036CF37A1